MRYAYSYDTPIGDIVLCADEIGITGVHFGAAKISDYHLQETDLLKQAATQLYEYFNHKRKVFDLPLQIFGTPFQRAVWNYLLQIPYGQTVSYKQVAQAIGNPKAVRAVGMANNRNVLPIFIPCHRVIGSNGKLTGYAGGLAIKQKLLELEQQ